MPHRRSGEEAKMEKEKEKQRERFCSENQVERSKINDVCSICHEEMKLSSSNSKEKLFWCRDKCGKNFHESCMQQWIETSKKQKCPNCRTRLKFSPVPENEERRLSKRKRILNSLLVL